MKLIELKIWPMFFQAVLEGRKPFEIRKNDREFKTGDELMLREWDPDKADSMFKERWQKMSTEAQTVEAEEALWVEMKERCYTGRALRRQITYVIGGQAIEGLQQGYVVLGIPAPEHLQLAEAVTVLMKLKGGCMEEKCFCEMSIGNPMVRDHSQSCKEACAFIEKFRVTT
jgi:hypothetical protein